MSHFDAIYKVLLVDDDEDDYMITREALAEAIYTRLDLDWVNSYEAGQAQIKASNHDIYLIDLHLGQHDGFELLQYAAEIGCQKPLILLTGQGEREFDLKALSLGAMDFLVKGQFSAALLERAIIYAIRHRQVLNELQTSEAQYRGVLENQAELVCRFDRDMVLTFVNGAFARYFGWPSAQLPGRSLTSLMPEEQFDQFASHLNHVFARQMPVTFELALPGTSSARKWQQWTIQPLPDKTQQVHEAQGVAVDISERKTAEIALRNALIREKELGELKSRFVSMTSHEFRTPLTTIMSTASFLEMADEKISTDKRLTRLSKIRQAARDMAELLDEVLVFGKAEANRLEFVPEAINLISFITEIVEDYRAGSHSSHQFVFNHPQQLKPFYGDIKLMRQVLSNLLSNAIKYAPVDTTITIDLTHGENQFILSISDQGIGIPEEDQPLIFDPFHRAHNTREYSGTGLGLAITRRAISRHEGDITFVSQPDKGTKFIVTLPDIERQTSK